MEPCGGIPSGQAAARVMARGLPGRKPHCLMHAAELGSLSPGLVVPGARYLSRYGDEL